MNFEVGQSVLIYELDGITIISLFSGEVFLGHIEGVPECKHSVEVDVAFLNEKLRPLGLFAGPSVPPTPFRHLAVRKLGEC